MEQAEQFSNSHWRKVGVTEVVQHLTVLHIDLLEVSHDNFAPPLILFLPLEDEMAFLGYVHLRNEIDLEYQRTGSIMKQTCLVYGNGQELLTGWLRTCQ